MTETDFDGLPALQGAITAVTVIDNDNTPNTVVDSDKAFRIRVNWEVRPPTVAVLLDGTWTVRAFAESIGPGSERLAEQNTVTANGGLAYSTVLAVPAGTLDSDTPPNSGVYKLAIVITYRNRLGVLTEMAAYSEGTTILVRNP